MDDVNATIIEPSKVWNFKKNGQKKIEKKKDKKCSCIKKFKKVRNLRKINILLLLCLIVRMVLDTMFLSTENPDEFRKFLENIKLLENLELADNLEKIIGAVYVSVPNGKLPQIFSAVLYLKQSTNVANANFINLTKISTIDLSNADSIQNSELNSRYFTKFIESNQHKLLIAHNLNGISFEMMDKFIGFLDQKPIGKSNKLVLFIFNIPSGIFFENLVLY